MPWVIVDPKGQVSRIRRVWANKRCADILALLWGRGTGPGFFEVIYTEDSPDPGTEPTEEQLIDLAANPFGKRTKEELAKEERDIQAIIADWTEEDEALLEDVLRELTRNDKPEGDDNRNGTVPGA